MLENLRKNLGFPHPPEYEAECKKRYVLQMYKPLLVVVFLLFGLLLGLLATCFFMPEWLAPDEYIPLFILIHFTFLVITFTVLCLSVLLRRAMLEHPNLYLTLCNGYGALCLIWGSLIAAYSDYSSVIFSAFVYVSLCVALVTWYKPWQAILVFMCNYAFYILLSVFVWPIPLSIMDRVSNAALAAVLSIAISIIIYRFRTRTYYSQITIRRQMDEINTINAQLQSLIHLDQLTGLYNRRFYEEALPGIVEQLLADGQTVCGMMLDVDHFKAYNDQYGHQAGDICLRRIVDLLRASAELEPIYIVRYGGEEFFVITAVDTPDAGQKQAEKIRRAIEDSFIEHLTHPLGRVTISIGVAICRRNGCHMDLRQITQAADKALYEAKETGRNRVASFSG